MKISLEDVNNIANLANLNLSGEEEEMFCGQLSDILSHIDTLNKLETNDVDDIRVGVTCKAPLREDIVRPSFHQGDLLANAPEKENGYFIVPKVIE